MSMVLQSNTGDFKPHPEGIYPAVCVDVIDMGLMETEFQGQKRLVHKVRLVFETEQKNDEGKNWALSRTFTASLNSKARLAQFLGKWRGRLVAPGETIDLGKLIGASCTLVLSHGQTSAGRLFVSIDAVSKPTKKVIPSGQYDPALARQRIVERGAGAAGVERGAAERGSVGAAFPQERLPAANSPVAAESKTAAGAPQSKPADFDPEVGF